jgi:N-acetylmuramoyl-L-alanine amidase-like protein
LTYSPPRLYTSEQPPVAVASPRLVSRGARPAMAAFDAQIKHWPTIAAFAAYLQGVPRPPWVTGLTNHNTYRPNEFTWQGLASMHSMTQVYIDKGWSAGPHLYLCAAAPNAADTGVWQLTPLGHVGVHAGACNDDHLGIEWVGDFEARQPTAEQYTLGITINLLILKHWGLPPGSVNVHRDCMPGRTCPGKHLTSEQIRASLRAPAPPLTKRYRARRLLIPQRQEGGPPYAGELVPGEEVVVDKWYTNGRVHLADGRGFPLLSDLEAI